MSDELRVVVKYLIAEDDEVQACLLAKLLKKVAEPCNIEVLVALNLQDALRISNEQKPHATFLDLHMPLIPGGPICDDWKRIADEIPNMKPPVIAITGAEVTREMKIYCMTEKGAHNVLQKPYDQGFFSKLSSDSKIFAADLIKEATAAGLRTGKANGESI